jgi:S1-C subfamily serine protease
MARAADTLITQTAKEAGMSALVNLSNELEAAVERASKSVVSVHGRARLGSTGIHWRPGLIVTADHTVQVDDDVKLTVPGGRTVQAVVAGRDPGLDLAVLKADLPDVPVAELGEAVEVRVGHLVLALGSGPRASWGIVSALGGEGRTRGAGTPMLNLDLTLYPGFSGGPLVDVQGRVIGVNTSSGSRHLRLAVPVSAVSRTVADLERRGRIPRAWLGVGTQAVRLPEAERERLGVSQRTAVIVVEVQPGSPAAAAGLTIGDVILALGGIPVTAPEDLFAILRPERVGQTVTASLLRGGQSREIPVAVGERPARS